MQYNIILTMLSAEKECILFVNLFLAQGNVEAWLNDFVSRIKLTI
jgi:hypothetical protein